MGSILRTTAIRVMYVLSVLLPWLEVRLEIV